MYKNTQVKNAFTLAELLITISIIGVVAVLILNVAAAITSKVQERSRNMAKAKLTQVMKVLNSQDLLHGITTTDEFADILEKHVKVIKRCDSEHLTSCFNKTITRETAKVLGNTTGLKYENTADIKKGEHLGFPANTSGNVGFVLADGLSMIFSYDTTCQSNPYDNMNAVDKCLIAIFDTNGMGNPNKLNEDIGLLNATLGAEACVDIGGLCVTVSDIPYSPTQAEPYTGIASEANGNCSNFNYWDGARVACEEVGMRLPTADEVGQIIFNADMLNLTSDYYWFDRSTEKYAWIYSKSGIWPDSTISKGCMHHAYLVRCVK